MDETYVTNAGWLRTAGREDLIDEVADSFERPSAAWPTPHESRSWSATVVSWPRKPRLRRSA